MLVRIIGIKAHPLELYNCVRVHPFWRYFGIQSEFFDLDGSKFVQIFSCRRVQEHSDFKKFTVMLLILQYLQSFNFFALLSLFTYLIVFIFHILCAVCHLYHYLLYLFKLDFSYFLHRFFIIFLGSCVISATHFKQFVTNVSDINLCLLATFQSFGRILVGLLFIGIDEGWKFGSGSIIASMILLSQFIPFPFFGNFIHCIVFIFNSC